MIHINLPSASDDAILLLVRLIVGFSFVVAARNKSRNFRKFAKNNGLPVPMAVIVALAEVVSGTALILGIQTQIAALVLMVLMLGTIRLHIFKWHSPYWAAQGGWEYDLMLLAMAGVIATLGAGSYIA